MGCAGSKGATANPPKSKDKKEGEDAEGEKPEEQPVSNF